MPKVSGKSAELRVVSDMAERLVRTEMAAGTNRPEAEALIAHNIGLAKNTLDNLRRGRLKDAAAIREKIRAAFVSELERQISKLQHELSVARALDRQVDFSAIEALLWQAQEKLRGPG